jgi:peroxiredoxin
MKLKKGNIAPDFQVEDLLDNQIDFKKLKGKKIYISFLRNTNCPLCSLHVLKISKQAEYLKSLGLVIFVFYESDKITFKYSEFFKTNVLDENRFSVISDPKRTIYDLFGAEISPEKSTLEALKNASRFATVEEATKLGITGNGIEAGTNPDAIPADFLIDENFVIQYAHYGNDAGDNIQLKLVEKFALNEQV